MTENPFKNIDEEGLEEVIDDVDMDAFRGAVEGAGYAIEQFLRPKNLPKDRYLK